ncbi:MAG: acyl-CoA dehydrogenase [Microbacteriaceae bacterium]
MAQKIRLNSDYLNRLILGTWPNERLAARELTRQRDFQRIDGLSVAEHRARVFGQLQKLVEAGAIQRAFPKDMGGEENHGGNIASFEELVLGDPSMQIKGGVQWGLFGAAILHLGTAEHHARFLPDIITLKTPGIYAMTEIGHGSDVDSIATTATFDEASDEFVIDTPFRAAWKTFLGNAAQDGKAAVLFAQLITKGVNHGVHAFYLDVRDEKGNFLPGIGGVDNGIKGGLNGIDNGMLHFDQVRIPRQNLLNRYGDVDAAGNYSSPIESPGRRFFTMLGTLVQGRVSLDGAATIASQVASYIGITYGGQRRQFADASGKTEMTILDYQRHQRRLLPRLARAYAGTFAHDYLLRKFDEVFSGTNDTEESRQELETNAAALKVSSTWNALDSLQESREATGGAGFMASNRLVGLRSDLDVYATFEGDNNVLLQLVGKRLLGDYAASMKHNPVGTLAGEFGRDLLRGSGLKKLGVKFVDMGSSKASSGRVLNSNYAVQLLQERIDISVARMARRLNDVRKDGAKAAFDAFNGQQNELIHTAYVYAELLQLGLFNEAVSKMTDPATQKIVGKLRDLFAMTTLEKYSHWFLVEGVLSTGRVKAISANINRILLELRPHAQDLVDAFGFDQEHIRAEITTGIEAERQNEAQNYYAKLEASGERPIHEKELRRKKNTKQAQQAALKAASTVSRGEMLTPEAAVETHDSSSEMSEESGATELKAGVS